MIGVGNFWQEASYSIRDMQRGTKIDTEDDLFLTHGGKEYDDDSQGEMSATNDDEP